MRDNEKGPLSTTFEDILREEYGGSLQRFCKKHAIDYQSLYGAVTGNAYIASIKQMRRGVAAMLGEDEDALFPHQLYPMETVFASIAETPAYRLLRKRHRLRFPSKNPFKLARLLRSVGLTPKEISRFYLVAMRHIPLYTNLKLCTKVADCLKISLQELFPTTVYRYSSIERRTPFLEKGIPLSLSSEAHEVLSATTTGNIDALRGQVLALLFKKIDKRSREVVVRILHGEDREAIAASLLNKVTEKIGVSDAAVSLIYQNAIDKMQKCLGAPEVQEALKELAAAERDARQADRVFI